MTRRTVLGFIAFLAPAALVLQRLGGGRSATRSDRLAPPGKAPGFAALRAPSGAVRAWLGDVRPGARIGNATVVAVHDVHFGAIPIRMRLDDGTTFQVDVVARGTTPGVVSTSSVTLHLANRADGSGATHEAAGLATMELGRLLAEREGAGYRAPSLLTQEARVALFPVGQFNV